MEHGLTSSSERADYTWASGLCLVRHRVDHILDKSVAKRVEEERTGLCPEHVGTVLHVIPSDIEMFDHDALTFWMSDESAEGIVARAAVVPSGITAFDTESGGCFSRQMCLSGCFEMNRSPRMAH